MLFCYTHPTTQGFSLSHVCLSMMQASDSDWLQHGSPIGVPLLAGAMQIQLQRHSRACSAAGLYSYHCEGAFCDGSQRGVWAVC